MSESQIRQALSISSTVAEKIRQRRLQMLVHSRLYYILDTNIISDSVWMRWAQELRQLQEDYPNIASQVIYAEAFKDWDGSSGAFLPLDDPWVINKANYILEITTI